jgi:YVTN family beta-propeller protein
MAEAGLGSPIPVGGNPTGVAVNPSTNRVYVANFSSQSVTVIDATTDTVIVPSIEVGLRPHGVAVNPATNRIYVANQDSANVSVIDGVTNSTAGAPIQVGSSPALLAVNPVTNRIYVANQGSNTVSVIDGATSTVVAPPISVGDAPTGVGVNPATNRIYVANNGGNTVTVIDGATNTVIGSPITVGLNPYGVAVNLATNRIYVANSANDTVSVIDGSTNAVIGSPITVGKGPTGIAVNPAINRVYVSRPLDSAVVVIDGATNAGLGSTAGLGANPIYLDVFPATGKAYVSNLGSHTVSAFGVPLSVSPGLSAPGGSTTATWSSLFGPNGADFVGLFQPDAPNSAPLSRVYTNGTTSPGGSGAAGGSVSLPIPTGLASGSYEVRLVAGTSGGTLARSTLTVANGPVATNDSYSTGVERVLTVPPPGVLANDTDADSPSLQVTALTKPAHGTLVLDANGAFTYAPGSGFIGTDSFTYKATDEAGLSSTASVSIAVNPVACGPRPPIQIQSAVANGALQVTVTASDVDGPTRNHLQELRFAAPVNGRVVLDGQAHTDAFTHTPPAGAAQVSFSVQRVTPGQATTVPLTATDRCGSWPTFVGGGASAGF